LHAGVEEAGFSAHEIGTLQPELLFDINPLLLFVFPIRIAE